MFQKETPIKNENQRKGIDKNNQGVNAYHRSIGMGQQEPEWNQEPEMLKEKEEEDKDKQKSEQYGISNHRSSPTDLVEQIFCQAPSRNSGRSWYKEFNGNLPRISAEL
jgi:hypothetical protein